MSFPWTTPEQRRAQKRDEGMARWEALQLSLRLAGINTSPRTMDDILAEQAKVNVLRPAIRQDSGESGGRG